MSSLDPNRPIIDLESDGSHLPREEDDSYYDEEEEEEQLYVEPCDVIFENPLYRQGLIDTPIYRSYLDNPLQFHKNYTKVKIYYSSPFIWYQYKRPIGLWLGEEFINCNPNCEFIIQGWETFIQKRNLLMLSSAKYHDLGVFEQLGISFNKVLPWIEKTIYKKVRGMSHNEMHNHFASWGIDHTDDLNFDWGYGTFRDIALLADGYTPATVGKGFETLPTNVIYGGLAIVGIPLIINSLSKLNFKKQKETE